MRHSESKTTHVLLIGGGHSHALALRNFAMDPLPGVHLTLVSDRGVTPYSGMLPGHLAGKYSYEECHIDLRRLMTVVGGEFIVDRVCGLDPVRNRVFLEQHPELSYDWLSIDVGSTPVVPEIEGAGTYGMPVKPWQPFLENWSQWIHKLSTAQNKAVQLVIVGGGAGGVELALNADAKLTEVLGPRSALKDPWTIHVVHRGDEIMTHHNAWVRQRCKHLLQQRGIQVYLKSEVQSVSERELVFGQMGESLAYDQLFWVTGAAAPEWLQPCGLELTPSGFISVDDELRSLSHPNIFATGDVATMQNYPRPKAGVFAVRQGKPLAENLRRATQGDPLQPFKPQSQFLSLIGTGRDRAIASWGKIPLGLESASLWNWKDQIDRAFMEKFSELSPMMDPKDSTSDQQQAPIMHCAGCGSKVGGSILTQVLNELKDIYPPLDNPNILLGLEGEDAAVVQVPDGKVMVQTVDYFRQIINDPYLFGKIATHHALSDLFAMGAQPQSAMAIATIPYGTPRYQRMILRQLLGGAREVLHQAGASLVGGHTTEGEELAFGLSCHGVANPEQLLRKNGLQPDNVLILTQPLGIGVIFAGQSQGKAQSHWIDQALEPMLQSNQRAADVAQSFGVTACTDITGFGLLGHLWEMVEPSGVRVSVELDEIQVLAGALPLIQDGVQSSLYDQNAQISSRLQLSPGIERHPHWPLLFDPQTSGGLLIAIPSEQADLCVQALKDAGFERSHQVGRVLKQDPNPAIHI